MLVNLDQLTEAAGVTPPHNREIARQTRLFEKLFCAGDEELLQGEGL